MGVVVCCREGSCTTLSRSIVFSYNCISRMMSQYGFCGADCTLADTASGQALLVSSGSKQFSELGGANGIRKMTPLEDGDFWPPLSARRTLPFLEVCAAGGQSFCVLARACASAHAKGNSLEIYCLCMSEKGRSSRRELPSNYHWRLLKACSLA